MDRVYLSYVHGPRKTNSEFEPLACAPCTLEISLTCTFLPNHLGLGLCLQIRRLNELGEGVSLYRSDDSVTDWQYRGHAGKD